MRKETKLCCAWLVTSMWLVGCSSQPGPAESAPTEAASSSAEADEPRAVTQAAPPSSTETDEPPAVPQAAPPSSTETDEPTAVPQAAPPSSSEAEPLRPSPPSPPVVVDRPEPTVPTSSPVVADPGGLVEVVATKPGLSRIGSEKCKLCHKVQFASWAETAHASRTPPLDCESCHGAGSEYKSLAVMKDPQQARAAGMVMPDRSFCSQCHTTGWTDDLLKRTHAHKVAGS